jgi:hypothetical protein
VRCDLDGLCVRLQERRVEELQTCLESSCIRGGHSAGQDSALTGDECVDRRDESPCAAFGDTQVKNGQCMSFSAASLPRTEQLENKPNPLGSNDTQYHCNMEL